MRQLNFNSKFNSLFLRILLALTLNFVINDKVYCQSSRSYIDSIRVYRKTVDSLVSSFYQNPETFLGHTIAHSKCLDGNGGATIDTYEAKGSIMQLVYFSTCDSPQIQKTFYFINIKIVFSLIEENPFGKTTSREEFYRDDLMLLTEKMQH